MIEKKKMFSMIRFLFLLCIFFVSGTFNNVSAGLIKETVTFDANGGVIVLEDGSTIDILKSGVPEGKTMTIDLLEVNLIPVREGYVFKGWKSSLDNEIYNESVTIDSTEVIFTAQWVKEFTVTYNVNGGNGDVSDQIKTEGVDLIINDSKPSREGYIFKGWNTKEDGTGTLYASGDKYSTDADLILYAQWVKGNKVTFKVDDNTDVVEVENGKKVLEPSIPIKEGYDFIGWYMDTEMTKKYNFDDKVNNDIILYGKFVKNTNNKTDIEIKDNVSTGNIMVIMAWIIGLGGIGYSIYYFITNKKL